MSDLRAVIHSFARQLLRDFAPDITRDARGFKKQVLRLVRQGLPPGRGRPRDPRFDTAVAMVNQGKSVKEVMRRQIPGFDQLDTYTRYLTEKGLRQALARRRRLLVDQKSNRKLPPENQADLPPSKKGQGCVARHGVATELTLPT